MLYNFCSIRMKKLNVSIFKRNKKDRSKSLSDLDNLYKNTIVCFSKDERVKYCQRLINRLNYELQNDVSINKKRRTEIDQLLKASKIEIQNNED